MAKKTARKALADMAAMQASAGEAAQLLRALANEQRLSLSQSALSQHLARLREGDLVETRREGLSVFYSLAQGPVRALMATLHEVYCP
jgi:DNA-binding transcriptional ArsR family regulator